MGAECKCAHDTPRTLPLENRPMTWLIAEREGDPTSALGGAAISIGDRSRYRQCKTHSL